MLLVSENVMPEVGVSIMSLKKASSLREAPGFCWLSPPLDMCTLTVMASAEFSLFFTELFPFQCPRSKTIRRPASHTRKSETRPCSPLSYLVVLGRPLSSLDLEKEH